MHTRQNRARREWLTARSRLKRSCWILDHCCRCRCCRHLARRPMKPETGPARPMPSSARSAFGFLFLAGGEPSSARDHTSLQRSKRLQTRQTTALSQVRRMKVEIAIECQPWAIYCQRSTTPPAFPGTKSPQRPPSFFQLQRPQTDRLDSHQACLLWLEEAVPKHSDPEVLLEPTRPARFSFNERPSALWCLRVSIAFSLLHLILYTTASSALPQA